MKSAYLLAIPLALLLTACTDIRSRISPDILAADVGKQTAYAMHASGKQGVLRASAAHPDLLCDALQNAAGAEVSTGHLTLLLVSGDAVRILPRSKTPNFNAAERRARPLPPEEMNPEKHYNLAHGPGQPENCPQRWMAGFS